MNKREAMAKLKRFWTENDGDYLSSLLQMRMEMPSGHRSTKSLEAEIIAVQEVYNDFLLWKEKKRKVAK